MASSVQAQNLATHHRTPWQRGAGRAHRTGRHADAVRKATRGRSRSGRRCAASVSASSASHASTCSTTKPGRARTPQVTVQAQGPAPFARGTGSWLVVSSGSVATRPCCQSSPSLAAWNAPSVARSDDRPTTCKSSVGAEPVMHDSSGATRVAARSARAVCPSGRVGAAASHPRYQASRSDPRRRVRSSRSRGRAARAAPRRR